MSQTIQSSAAGRLATPSTQAESMSKVSRASRKSLTNCFTPYIRNGRATVVNEVGIKALSTICPSMVDAQMSAGSRRSIDRSTLLPNEIWGKVISYLPDPESVKNLVQTSQRMRALLTDPYIVELFLHTLAKARGDRPEVIAVNLGSQSGRVFLENYIREAQLDDAYQFMQKTTSLLSDLLEEANGLFARRTGIKNTGVKFFYAHKYDPSHKLHRYKTSAGFSIYVDPTSVWVCHPFGAMLIHRINIGSSESRILECAETVIKRLQAKFQGFCTHKVLTEGEIAPNDQTFAQALYTEVQRPARHGNDVRTIEPIDIQEINRQHLEQKKGSTNLIMSSDWGHHSVYKVDGAFGVTLPSPQIKQPNNQKYSNRLVRRILDILEKRFGKLSTK